MGRSRPPEVSSQRVEVAGLPIHYLATGRGKTITFLHGWGGEAASFGPVPTILADRFHSIVVDLPGFGRTPPPPAAWGTFEYADCLASFLRQIDVAPCALVGHSFGGRVSLALAARYPDLVEKLILVDSAGIVPHRGLNYYVKIYLVKTVRRLLALLPLERWREGVMRRLYRRIGSNDYNATGDPIMRGVLVRVVNEDLRELLPRIAAPTLLIWGDQDRDTPISDGRLMERLIPDAGLVVFEGAGHFAYLDRLDQFCRVLAHFVEH